MPNAWQQPTSIAAEALVHLEDALVITRLGATDKTADFLARPNGYAIGDTVKIKTRAEYEVKEFSTVTEPQGIRQSTRPMSIEKWFDVSVELTAREKALDLDSFSEDVIQPALYELAEKIDLYTGTKILEAAGLYASDDVFGTQDDMAQARAAANLQQLNPNRLCLVDNTLEAKLLGKSFFSTYDQRGQAGADAFNRGMMGNAMGMDFYASMQFPESVQATVGDATTTTDSDGTTNLIGLSVLTVAAVTGAATAGARLSIAGVKRPVIVASAVSDSDTTVQLVDPITEIIPDGAAVTVIGAGETNLAARGVIMDDRALSFAMPMLDSPSDKPSSVMSSNGYSLRVVTGYDMSTKKEMLSIDCLVGAAAYDPRRMCLLRDY